MTLKTAAAGIMPFVLSGYVIAGGEIDPLIDANGDGRYSYPELLALTPDLRGEAFSVLDLDGDGLIDEEELTSAVLSGAFPPT